MASGVKRVSVQVDADVLAKLDSAAYALSGLSTAYIHGSNDPRVHARPSAPKGNAKRTR